MHTKLGITVVATCLIGVLLSSTMRSDTISGVEKIEDSRFVTHISDPGRGQMRMYWKEPQGRRYGSLGRLKKFMEAKYEELIFATNGGRYDDHQRPLGLYVEAGRKLSPMNEDEETRNGFFIQPSGVFYLTTDLQAFVSTKEDYPDDSTVNYATQSGPMLVTDGEINSYFKRGSTNLQIRNGVGILPDGKVLFAISTEKMSYYDLARFFKNKGCLQALYLDGNDSRAYVPAEEWEQLDGRFAVIIGETSGRPLR
ncbi:phosphodiester glycosidase family protein [Pontibacter sp. G13]|uniref:phosphodiester glycosidase family protein n=1 Tax=Pontibacter sp. G13 TaxID=3074898 RepID=UPI002889A772|nr:phosphodiester glycosidase family protein [Pontibacter sp. G13]WNJ18400.1 phosphodiester glycosidase family protein [Pontibacter sp. G13]